MMTIVSVVYSILLVALSLTSVQFSTRILAGFVRDRASQWVLGLLLGSFVYALVVLRSIRLDPPFVPVISVAIALLFALAALGALVWFIDHIANGIQANHLIDRIATETEPVIDDVFSGGEPLEPEPEVPTDAIAIRARRSGYLQLLDLAALEGACAEGRTVALTRAVGQFVASGAPIAWVAPDAPAAVQRQILDAIDIGVSRTLQQDAEWGLRQIVDIGLKAISPAVNDPSTGATCIDHLTRLLIRAGGREAPPRARRIQRGILIVPTTHHLDLVDLAYEQLRQYGRSDMAIALRLARSMFDVAEACPRPAVRARIAHHARLLASAVRAAFPAEDRDDFERRVEAIARVTTPR